MEYGCHQWQGQKTPEPATHVICCSSVAVTESWQTKLLPCACVQSGAAAWPWRSQVYEHGHVNWVKVAAVLLLGSCCAHLAGGLTLTSSCCL